MKEAIIGLIGVAVGGTIGMISTYIQQYYAHKHWKTEARLTYLKNERQRCQEGYTRMLSLMEKAPLSQEAFALFLFTAPPEFDDQILRLENADPKTKIARLHILIQDHIRKLDDEIKNTLPQA